LGIGIGNGNWEPKKQNNHQVPVVPAAAASSQQVQVAGGSDQLNIGYNALQHATPYTRIGGYAQ
jgi:hypothetical protein